MLDILQSQNVVYGSNLTTSHLPPTHTHTHTQTRTHAHTHTHAHQAELIKPHPLPLKPLETTTTLVCVFLDAEQCLAKANQKNSIIKG